MTIIEEKSINVSVTSFLDGGIKAWGNIVKKYLANGEIPVRVVATPTETINELSLNISTVMLHNNINKDLFYLRKREYENTNEFNIALIIPTGVGASLGGHSGDGGAFAKVLAKTCDKLITHPNVVNAADLNEMSDNVLYIEGSTLTRLFMGSICLQPQRTNRLLVIFDNHEEKMFNNLGINSVSAARATLGIEVADIKFMDNKMTLHATFTENGRAAGKIEGFDQLINLLENHSDIYDAIAISTGICIPVNYHLDYFSDEYGDGVNPWGGVEALLTHTITEILGIPSAHSPMMASKEIMDLDVGICDPRKASEAVSSTYMHCILKGLNQTPKILTNLELIGRTGIMSVEDLSCLVIPYGCVGLPVLAAIEQKIPIIAIRDKSCRGIIPYEQFEINENKLFVVENHLEAIGVIESLKAGVSIDSIKRPMKATRITY